MINKQWIISIIYLCLSIRFPKKLFGKITCTKNVSTLYLISYNIRSSHTYWYNFLVLNIYFHLKNCCNVLFIFVFFIQYPSIIDPVLEAIDSISTNCWEILKTLNDGETLPEKLVSLQVNSLFSYLSYFIFKCGTCKI